MSIPTELLDSGRRLLQSVGATNLSQTSEPIHDDRMAAAGATALLIGAIGMLPCWIVAAPLPVSRKLARRLSRSGEPVLLIGGRDDGSMLHLVVSIEPIRVINLADPRLHPSATPLMRLRRARLAGHRLGDALAVVTALDVDAAGRKAFHDIRELISRTAKALPAGITAADRRAWLLLQVTRLLFLRFVESEGWLDGRPDFLATAVDSVLASGRNPGDDLLDPLFFGTLNQPPQNRSETARRFGRIPFLNGGLFEPHPLERATRWSLPTGSWQELLDPLVAGIEVTLDIDGTSDRISPEMLGRILEGLMDPDERASGGVFYTPPDLVDSLVQASLSCHLASRLGRSENAVRKALGDPDPQLRTTLDNLRVLDPAVGSGAFLVGMLRAILANRHQDHRLVKRLLMRSLHGIDRQPAAVRITELRLWLELLRSLRGKPPEQLRPLPNLDAAVRSGDALLDPLSGAQVPIELLAKLKSVRARADRSHGREHALAVTELRSTEAKAMVAALQIRQRIILTTLADCDDAATTAEFFPGMPRAMPTCRRWVKELEDELVAIQARLERLDRDGAAAGFALESAWAGTIADGGFDLVIGNPPWVRAERLPKPTRAALSGRYRWWRGSGPGFRHAPDLSVAFIERALEVLRPGGTLGFVVPGKLATTRYATVARAALVRETTLNLVADLADDPRAGFAATTYPLALIATRKLPDPDARVRLGLHPNSESTRQSEWRETNAWITGGETLTRLVSRLTDRFPVVGENFRPALGVKTGANDVFLDPPTALRRWTRPALRGRDLTVRGIRMRHRLLWTMAANGQPLEKLPPKVAEFLASHEDRLRSRADQQRGPWWQLFRTAPSLARWRLIWPDLATTLRVVPLSDPKPLPLNSCYVMPLPDQRSMMLMAGWMRQRPIRALARLAAEPAAGGHARFGARVVAALPCPDEIWHEEALALAVTGEDDHGRIASRLLGLTKAEVEALDAIVPAGG